MAARKVDTEEYGRATARAREIRERVAGQLFDLVLESDRMGSSGEVSERVMALVERRRQLAECHGRQQQAFELGLPRAALIEEQREAEQLLRDAVMSLGVACAGWVAAIDLERQGGPE